MLIRKTVAVLALLAAGASLSGCYDRYGRPGHDSDRHGGHHGGHHRGDRDHDRDGRPY